MWKARGKGDGLNVISLYSAARPGDNSCSERLITILVMVSLSDNQDDHSSCFIHTVDYFFILSFRLNILLGGTTPLYFHMVNVCLHCAVTGLLMHMCKCCVFEDSRLAFITALLFAVHPVHTEAVSI